MAWRRLGRQNGRWWSTLLQEVDEHFVGKAPVKNPKYTTLTPRANYLSGLAAREEGNCNPICQNKSELCTSIINTPSSPSCLSLSKSCFHFLSLLCFCFLFHQFAFSPFFCLLKMFLMLVCTCFPSAPFLATIKDILESEAEKFATSYPIVFSKHTRSDGTFHLNCSQIF